jgi:hypothetical protein
MRQKAKIHPHRQTTQADWRGGGGADLLARGGGRTRRRRGGRQGPADDDVDGRGSLWTSGRDLFSIRRGGEGFVWILIGKGQLTFFLSLTIHLI